MAGAAPLRKDLLRRPYWWGFGAGDTGDIADVRGDVLGIEGGKAGNLGGRSVIHLHFEMYHPDAPDPTYPGHGNQVIDPTPILREKGAL